MFPFCCLPRWTMGADFVRNSLYGTLQYVPIGLLCGISSLLAYLFGTYEEGVFAWGNAYVYIAFVRNCSQIWALYSLVLFYRATESELQDIKALLKFVCVKLIVFFTFWQSVAVSGLMQIKEISAASEGLQATFQEAWNQNDNDLRKRVGSGLQNFIICVEMLFFAVMHVYAFPYTEFQNPPMKREKNTGRRQPIVRRQSGSGEGSKFINGINFFDIWAEVKEVAAIGDDGDLTRDTDSLVGRGRYGSSAGVGGAGSLNSASSTTAMATVSDDVLFGGDGGV